MESAYKTMEGQHWHEIGSVSVSILVGNYSLYKHKASLVQNLEERIHLLNFEYQTFSWIETGNPSFKILEQKLQNPGGV